MDLTRLAPHRARLSAPGLTADVGILDVPAGTRLPADGVSRHDQDEIAFLLAGELRAWSGGREYRLIAGDATLIPAGEEHWAEVVQDARIAYALVKRA